MPSPFTATITRSQFRTAIEAGITRDFLIAPYPGDRSLTTQERGALRRLAERATHATVGVFDNCPMTQIGMERMGALPFGFIFGFDDAVKQAIGSTVYDLTITEDPFVPVKVSWADAILALFGKGRFA